MTHVRTAQARGTRAVRLAGGLALALALVAGCTGDDQRPAPVEQSAGEQVAQEPVAKDFGETHAYEDGISLTVSAPEPYEPTEGVASDEAPAYVVVEVRLRNGGTTDYDPSLVAATVTSGGQPGAELLDVEGDVQGAPADPVPPGEEITFRLGFGVQDPDDVVLQVRPDFDRAPVRYGA